MTYFFVYLFKAKTRILDLFYLLSGGVTEEFLSVEVMKLDFQYSRPIYVIIQQIIYGICHVWSTGGGTGHLMVNNVEVPWPHKA